MKKKTRTQLIEAGKIWQVYPDKDYDNILFEGTESAARIFIRTNHNGAFKKGLIRIAKVIYEPDIIDSKTQIIII